MMIALNSCACKGEKKSGEVKESIEEFEGNVDYEGMVQPNQQHVVPCVKEMELGLGPRKVGEWWQRFGSESR